MRFVIDIVAYSSYQSKDQMRLTIQLLFAILLFSISAVAQSSFTIGEIQTIESKHLGESRTLNIYLPKGYPNDTVSYQTIYLLDGSADEDFLHIVGLVQFFDLQFQAPPTIVVGIANVDRKRDFTFPTTDKSLQKDYPTTGGSANFIAFLKDELQPYLSANYKVNTERILIGQSLGGLLATEILLKDPSLFTKYLIVSPSLWWDNESMYQQMGDLIKKQKYKGIEVIVSVGKEHPMMIKEAAGLYEALTLEGGKDLKLDYQYFEKEDHATVLHVSIYQAFKALYGQLERD
ncbi:alpha/beta hydrolase-fold protein [Reichenbachiella carrageenanivorans]|uniref:Alpha/beta hydrolase-fold protein n=1 Tax=Reichenbachiella carrageenanivorans TaxID=2979869 RepID=A0ABY6D2I7_9BACT|nr:alpha/beta hydrolase-fold protein [Reichenbachiella carrageenanivorans]UXX80366.1 alpha/beta hydrolase-fold protein [Reichenbachiella carrageenanivorans]